MNMKDHPCMSSKNDEWTTPQDFFDALNKQFNFQVDAAANRANTKCPVYLDNALNQDWHNRGERIWLNPPYSLVSKFVQKAYEESRKGCTVVCLIPSRTSNKWWHEYAMKADTILFVKGRLNFGNALSGAPFPSCVLIFRGATDVSAPKILSIGAHP